MDIEPEVALPTAVLWIIVVGAVIYAPKLIGGTGYPLWEIIAIAVLMLPITYIIVNKASG